MKILPSLRTRTHKEAQLNSNIILKEHLQIYLVSPKISQFCLILHLVKVITSSFPNFKAIIQSVYFCAESHSSVTSWMPVTKAYYLHRGCHNPRNWGWLLFLCPIDQRHTPHPTILFSNSFIHFSLLAACGVVFYQIKTVISLQARKFSIFLPTMVLSTLKYSVISC